MRRLTVAVVALVAGAASLTVPAAVAGVPVEGPEGLFCRFAAVSDPSPDADPDYMTGEVDAGPALANTAGEMRCTIQVDAPAHDDPDAAYRTIQADASGLVLGMAVVSFEIDEHSVVYLCTSYHQYSNNTTLYWTPEPVGRWHTDPSKSCSVATSVGTQHVWGLVDEELCEELAVDAGWNIHGNGYIDVEGDVFIDVNRNGVSETEAMDELFYDCPVYTHTIDDVFANPDADHAWGPTKTTTPSVIDY